MLPDAIKLPQGSYIEWSGQYENQVRAKRRLQIVMPVVLLVIYLLLYLTYRSFLEAAHVLLAVPFALSGGVFLLYALGYNFSVAVWVGFIALFGTAVQTTVVMVIYLEEAVERKREETRRVSHASSAPGGRDGGGSPQAQAEGDDGVDGGGQPAADHVEHLDRCRGDATARDPGPGRHDQLAGPRAAGDSRHLLLAQGAGASSCGGARSSQKPTVEVRPVIGSAG